MPALVPNQRCPAVPGKVGQLEIGGYIYPVSEFVFDMSADAVEIPSVASLPYSDVLPGVRSASLVTSGFVRKNFNPWAEQPNLQFGKYKLVVMTVYAVKGNPTSPDNQIATAPSCLLTKATYHDVADDLAQFNFTIKASWTFTNWSNDNA